MSVTDPGPVPAKPALRRAVRDQIDALSTAKRGKDEAVLIDHLTRRYELRSASIVLLYLNAFPEEIDTESLLDLVLKRGQTLVLPRVDRRSRQLALHRIDHPAEQLRPGALGILEPAPTTPLVDPDSIDWVLVPGLAFDLDGFRLGRGGGFYDRLLAGLPNRIPCWSIAFDCQIVDALPREPHDQPVHGTITPSRVVTGCRP